MTAQHDAAREALRILENTLALLEIGPVVRGASEPYSLFDIVRYHTETLSRLINVHEKVDTGQEPTPDLPYGLMPDLVPASEGQWLRRARILGSEGVKDMMYDIVEKIFTDNRYWLILTDEQLRGAAELMSAQVCHALVDQGIRFGRSVTEK